MRAPIQRIILPLTALGAIGALLRFASWKLPELPIEQLSGMTLFAPVSIVAIWLGWRPIWRSRELLTLLMVLLLSFLQWNTVMLWGLPLQAVPFALGVNAAHWGLFLLFASTMAGLLRSLSGLSLHPCRMSLRFSPATAPARTFQFSLRQITFLATLACFAVLFYKTSVLDRPGFLFRSAWYQIFPSDLRTIVSGAVGGFLAPICWGAVWCGLQWKSWRLAALIVLIPLLAMLRAGAGGLYWDAPVEIMGTDALQSNLNPLATDVAWLKVSATTPKAQATWAAWLIEAAVQMLWILLSLTWIRKAGFEISRSPPSPAPSQQRDPTPFPSP
ncbi:hypothetical protein [Pirellula sp. SH-Sr6A]|uniref:hypothetical protein n=1 Tax=Pirellula sp. SH-Sr6A TaxID=1632865 RepID=UPI00197C4A94|nr:hypothetical protein [Pirellula sp. SH-Sr6A]